MSKISNLNYKQNQAIDKVSMYQPVKVLKMHDDGDATVRIGKSNYVVDTEGHIFKEIHHTVRK